MITEVPPELGQCKGTNMGAGSVRLYKFRTVPSRMVPKKGEMHEIVHIHVPLREIYKCEELSLSIACTTLVRNYVSGEPDKSVSDHLVTGCSPMDNRFV